LLFDQNTVLLMAYHIRGNIHILVSTYKVWFSAKVLF